MIQNGGWVNTDVKEKDNKPRDLNNKIVCT